MTLTGYDPDKHLDTLTYQVDTPPTHGTISGSEPNRTYTPDPDYVGVDTFAFVANDGQFLSAPELVTVTMTAVNDAPRFVTGEDGALSGFAFRVAGTRFDASCLTTLGEMQVGRGFKTIFAVDFVDPDAFDNHMVEIDWDDGNPAQPEGRLLEDGTITGPLLTEGRDGGVGNLFAEHVFTANGSYAVNICVTDNVSVDGNGDKSATADSLTTCDVMDVTVSDTTDLLLEVEESSDPTPIGETLTYTLTLINNAPEQGTGVTATSLVVTETLDARLEWQYADTADGTCTHADGTVTCNLDALDPGETASIEIGVALDSNVAPGDVLETAAGFQLNEPNQSDEQRTGETTTVVAPADYIVNTIEDGADVAPGDATCATSQGRCTMRAAIEEANAQSGRQTIALGYETYELQGALDVQDDTTIVGLGADASILASNGDDRVLSVAEGVALTLRDLAISGGVVEGPGGGVYNTGGVVMLIRVQVSGNHASAGGGGLYNASGHEAGAGGGLSNQGTADLTNVTISANHATGSGGGINGGPETTLRNTIVAGNSAAIAAPDCAYTLTSEGHNLIGDLSDCTILGKTANNIIGQEAGLDPLDLNDARTLTQALSVDSPAVDGGSCELTSDQRGIERPQGNSCDIGAFELKLEVVYLPIVVRPNAGSQW